MILTDTHTHFYYEKDAEKRVVLMQRCLENGVERLFLPNVNLATITLVSDVCAQFPQNCFPMLGLHPCDVKAEAEEGLMNYQQELLAMRPLLKTGNFVAVGEIGIDLYWDKTTLAIQQEAFSMQIDWALQMDLPVVIHSRDAFDEVFEMLSSKQNGKLRGIFHCFTGSLQQAEQLIELGFFLGVGGVVTYKNSGLDQVLANVDLRHVVLETDSPYLAPVPYRGKPNESRYIIHVAQKLADVKQIPVEEIAKITTENSKRIFGI